MTKVSSQKILSLCPRLLSPGIFFAKKHKTFETTEHTEHT